MDRTITGFTPQELAFLQTALLHRMIHYAGKLEPLDYACHEDRKKIAYLKQQYTAAEELTQTIDATLRRHHS